MYSRYVVATFSFLVIASGVSKCDSSQCAETIYASDVPRWLASNGSNIDYRDGVWYVDGVSVGVSSTEDSDVCVV